MTSRSICASAGRGPKLGEASARAYRYQPPCHKAGLARMSWRSGVVIERVRGVIMARCHDVQAGNAVADLAQAQAQFGGGGSPVKTGLLQHLGQDASLLLVQKILQIFRNGHRVL